MNTHKTEEESGEDGRQRSKVDGLHAVLASAIRERRTSLGWSQQDLVNRLTDLGTRLTKNALAQIETGHRRVDLNELPALCIALQTNLPDLLLGDNETVRYGEGTLVLDEIVDALFDREDLEGDGPWARRQRGRRDTPSAVLDEELRDAFTGSARSMREYTQRLSDYFIRQAVEHRMIELFGPDAHTVSGSS